MLTAMLKLWSGLLCQIVVNMPYNAVGANSCLGGQDIFATVRENSPAGEFIANLSIIGDPEANRLDLYLTGPNADWFFLESNTIRLNSSLSRTLDREVQGSILMAALTCYENDTVQSEYRIMVEILNENDNSPSFLEHTVEPFYISELTSVNTVAFTVQADDADEDIIIYVIDQNWPDSRYFRIDLPNSGKVILDKPLDYETKTQLQFVLYAAEMHTKEKNSATATITVNVLDGDDQYPYFLPCIRLSKDKTQPICVNPVYIANSTERDQNKVLHFSPGPICAEDGDRGLRTPVLYTLLSGADNGRFHINNVTGEIVQTRSVKNRLLTPTLRLRIMAYQIDDPKKYSVATALIRILAVNHFPPRFNKTTYKGIITESSAPAALVSNYENTALVVQATDLDFRDGVNPHIQYSLSPKSNITRLYRITQEGLVIAKINQLKAFDRQFLQVLATDQESGEVVRASIYIEVLKKGQAYRRPLEELWMPGRIMVGTVCGVSVVALLLLGASVILLLQLFRRQRRQRTPADRGQVALGKHPNVVSHEGQVMEDIYQNEAFDNGRTNSLAQGKHGMYSKEPDVLAMKSFSWDRNDSISPQNAPKAFSIPMSLTGSNLSSIQSNRKTVDKSLVKSTTSQEESRPKDIQECGTGQLCSRAQEMNRLHTDCFTSQPMAGTASCSADPGHMEDRDAEDLSEKANLNADNTAPDGVTEQEHTMM